MEQIADVYKRFDQKQGGIEKVFLEVTSFLRPRSCRAANNHRRDSRRHEQRDQRFKRTFGLMCEV